MLVRFADVLYKNSSFDFQCKWICVCGCVFRGTPVVPFPVSQARGTSSLGWSAGGSDAVGPKNQGCTQNFFTTNSGLILQYVV